jgi:hypothetical protein
MNIKILEEKINDINVIQIEDGEFKGCQFIIGGIEFDQKEEGLLHFDYEITNQFTVEKERMEDFVNMVGSVLTGLIDEALEQQSLIYKNGVDSAPEYC